jgi:alginate O-acetyltransferase complex protein AlgI
MSRLIAILLVGLAAVGVLEVISFGKQAELHVYHLSVSPGGNELLREPLHAGQPVTLRADARDSLAIELDPKGKQIGGVITITGSNGRATLRMFDDKILGPGERDCTTGVSGGWECKVFWRITKARTMRLPLFPAVDAVTIASVTFSTTSIPRAPATTFAALLLFLALLVVLAPLIVMARRVSPRLELSVLIGLSAAWIATTGVVSALAIAAFLALGYFLVRLELRRRETRTSILLLAVGFVALVLFYFKVLSPYASAAFGQMSSLAFPLGLSYFGIRLIDVIFAARAGTLKEVSAVEFFGFMLHPSMLAAGPITTLGEFRRARIADWSITDYGSGIARCLVGLVKKSSADLLLAPGVLKLTQTVALHPDTVSARVVWPMLLGQLLYIYLDFSGYTDLALGTGRALGWRLPENFNWPLVKSNLQRYWQSWHMTLSNWVMRRVYFPAFMQSRSPILAAVCAMFAIGVWHQPDFAWTAWALHHGIGLGVTIKCRDVGFREGGILARCASTPRGRVTMGLIGWALTVSWVALGLSYTLFDNYLVSFSAIRAAFRF